MKNLWPIAADLHRLCDGQAVFIGGVAVQALTRKLGAVHGLTQERTSDVDVAVASAAGVRLRDQEELTLSKRCKKASARVGGVDVDIYIEGQNGLRFDYPELAERARCFTIDKEPDVQIASIGHLILLKIDAMKIRASSERIAKDRRDLAKLLVLGADCEEDAQILGGAATTADVAAMQEVLTSTAFVEIVQGNAKGASNLRAEAAKFLQCVKKARGGLKPLPIHFDWDPVMHARSSTKIPPGALRATVPSLCRRAGIPVRATVDRPVYVYRGRKKVRTPAFDLVGVPVSPRSREGALRALEKLAFSFFDHFARCCVCGRGYFTTVQPR